MKREEVVGKRREQLVQELCLACLGWVTDVFVCSKQKVVMCALTITLS